MRLASITETKNRLSELLDYVRRGETVVITDRGVPIARLESAATRDPDTHDGRVLRLARAGLARPGAGEMVTDILDTAPPRTRGATSVVETVLDERREGW
jgi:prevent-host-death family protein